MPEGSLGGRMNNHTIVTLKKGEGRTIKAGGAWIFDNEIDNNIEGVYLELENQYQAITK